jgi:hypothetical protein
VTSQRGASTRSPLWFSIGVFDSNAAPGSQAVTRSLDAAQKTRIIFEPIIKPVALGREADQ